MSAYWLFKQLTQKKCDNCGLELEGDEDSICEFCEVEAKRRKAWEKEEDK